MIEKELPTEIQKEQSTFSSASNMARLKKSIAEMEKTGDTVHEVKLDDESVDRRCVGRF